jgi:hypothetical protein
MFVTGLDVVFLMNGGNGSGDGSKWAAAETESGLNRDIYASCEDQGRDSDEKCKIPREF